MKSEKAKVNLPMACRSTRWMFGRNAFDGNLMIIVKFGAGVLDVGGTFNNVRGVEASTSSVNL